MAPDHYAQCPVRNSTNWPAKGPIFCLCYLIAKVEAEAHEHLRTQVKVMPKAKVAGVLYAVDDVVSRDEVLALLGGAG
jgi:hypothetical protein